MNSEGASTPPLRGLNGRVPAAPSWFVEAVNAPFDSFTAAVRGADIDCRAWGTRGKPGLVLVHGNGAHLGWWSFLAPFFANTHRVVAFSLSGMGSSGWRSKYSIDDYAAETLAAAKLGGAYDQGLPVFIGHSLGGAPVLRIASQFADQLHAAIAVDTALPGPEMTALPPRPAARIYPDLPSALDRFRFSPEQPCDNLYIADHLARMGLKPVESGWAWRFDRNLFGQIEMGDPWADLAAAKVPIAIVRGARSELTNGAMGARIRSVVPDGTPIVTIPEAYHHVMADQPLALVAALRALLEAWA